MSKQHRTFLVVKTGSMQPMSEAAENGSRTTSYHGSHYTEEELRAWAEQKFDTTEEASLEDIARDIKHGGWLLHEGIWPSETQMDKSLMQDVADGFQGDLEAYAESIEEAFRTGLFILTKSKTVVTKVTKSKAVITTTVMLAPRQPAQHGAQAGF